jgi:hypothetical protein
VHHINWTRQAKRAKTTPSPIAQPLFSFHCLVHTTTVTLARLRGGTQNNLHAMALYVKRSCIS